MPGSITYGGLWRNTGGLLPNTGKLRGNTATPIFRRYWGLREGIIIKNKATYCATFTHLKLWL